MNIDAKICHEPRSNVGNLRVNEPLGEAYSAYWNWWLKHFAHQAEARFPDVYARCTQQDPDAKDALSRIGMLYEARGCAAVFGLARALGRPSGFDVISHLLTSAQSVSGLVRRWSGVLALQSSIRFEESFARQEFIVADQCNSLVLSPYKVRPANQKPFGPAMLAGVATGTLESAGIHIQGIWSVTRGGASYPMYRFGTFHSDGMDFDSDILIVLSEDTPGLKRDAGLMPPARSLSFCHLVNRQTGPGANRLLERVVGSLERSEGEHPGLTSTAAELGLSPRSLSRRLTEAGLGYARLVRFVRLRKATRLLAAGNGCLDDVAYQASYSDRHHMSRDFRKMAQLTPAGLRELLAR
ncbi:AraC-like DNA-binding protein [Labrenzia sp. MBR-25]